MPQALGHLIHERQDGPCLVSSCQRWKVSVNVLFRIALPYPILKSPLFFFCLFWFFLGFISAAARALTSFGRGDATSASRRNTFEALVGFSMLGLASEKTWTSSAVDSGRMRLEKQALTVRTGTKQCAWPNLGIFRGRIKVCTKLHLTAKQPVLDDCCSRNMGQREVSHPISCI